MILLQIQLLKLLISFFFSLTQNRVLSPIFSIFLEQARQFSVGFFFWKHCSSGNQFQNNPDKFLNDCYKEKVMLENTQNQLWLCRSFSVSGYCVTEESCWPQGSSIWIHIRLHLPFSGTWSLSGIFWGALQLYLACIPGSSSSGNLAMDEGLGRAGFHVDLGCNRYFFDVQNMARRQTHSEEL